MGPDDLPGRWVAGHAPPGLDLGPDGISARTVRCGRLLNRIGPLSTIMT